MDTCSIFLYTVFFVVSLPGGREALNTTTDEGVSTGTAAECVNKIDNCYHYPRDVICHGIYVPWATDRCSRYCGFCTASGTEKPCVDAIPNCVKFDPCHNPSFFIWVNENCRKFCNICTGTPQETAAAVTGVTHTTGTAESGHTTTMIKPTTATSVTSTIAPPSCADNVAFCHLYSKVACEDRTWAITFCPHFCNVCQHVAATSPMTTAPSMSTAGQTDTSRASSVATGSSVAGSSPSSIRPGCVNQLSFCDNYTKAACQDVQWARTYCAAFCGVCD